MVDSYLLSSHSVTHSLIHSFTLQSLSSHSAFTNSVTQSGVTQQSLSQSVSRSLNEQSANQQSLSHSAVTHNLANLIAKTDSLAAYIIHDMASFIDRSKQQSAGFSNTRVIPSYPRLILDRLQSFLLTFLVFKTLHSSNLTFIRPIIIMQLKQ